MARFRQIEEPEPHSHLASLYQEIVENGLGKGRPINWFVSQSERPDLLEATWRLTKALLLQGQLPSTVKQMLLLKVSMQNDCRYCRVLHTSALEAMGVPEEVIDSLTGDVSLEKLAPTQRAIVRFGLKIAQAPQSITDGDLRALRSQGLTSGEIMEAAMMAVFSNFVNAWADVSDVAVDSYAEAP